MAGCAWEEVVPVLRASGWSFGDVGSCWQAERNEVAASVAARSSVFMVVFRFFVIPISLPRPLPLLREGRCGKVVFQSLDTKMHDGAKKPVLRKILNRFCRRANNNRGFSGTWIEKFKLTKSREFRHNS